LNTKKLSAEAKKFLGEAKKLLADEDIVVRIRAVQIMNRHEPKAIVPLAARLLEARNDVLRFEVFKVLAEHGDSRSAPVLESLVKDPDGSLNPYMLQIHAVEALARCGRPESVTVLAPLVADANVDNQLTFEAVNALGAIGERAFKAKDKEGGRSVTEALVRAYPSARPVRLDVAYQRRAIELYHNVHNQLSKVTGKKLKMPPQYTETSRAKLIRDWLE